MQAIDFAKSEKKHRAPKSGAKANKKKDNKKKKQGLSKTERNNPKAFSVHNIVRTKRTQQRNLDRAQKKEVVPLVSRAEELPPPLLVVIMGPAGVGKSTLIRSLVKMFTGQNMTDTKGPITCVAGRKQRITLFECPLDIYSMTDLAKTADLVLLMIDASYGFEMETFEYLNMLQLHGFPKVMGVLTHLDKFKVSKTLQNTKKVLKNRFWTEIYKGAKVFDLSGVINGKYLKHEVKRLSLYLMRVKCRPLVWRNTHPYVVVDRVEDVTPVMKTTADPQCDREITLYGYLRGSHMRDSMRVHLIGAGDFEIAAMSVLDDPCPLPKQVQGGPSDQGGPKRSSLKAKDTLLYAPMANVGRVQIDDRDGVYIELKNIHYTKKENLQMGERDGGDEGSASSLFASGAGVGAGTPADLLRSMQDVRYGVDELMDDAVMSMFPGSRGIKSSLAASEIRRDEEEDDEDDGDDEDDEDGSENDEDCDMSVNDREEDDMGDDDQDEDDDDEEDDGGEDEYLNDDDYDDVDQGDDSDAAGAIGNGRAPPTTAPPRGQAKGLGVSFGNADPFASLKGRFAGVEAEAGAGAVTMRGPGGDWKDDMKGKAVKSYLERVRSGGDQDIMRRVYGANWEKGARVAGDVGGGDDDDDDDDEELFKIKSSGSVREKYNEVNAIDSNRAGTADRSVFDSMQKWKDVLALISSPGAASASTATSTVAAPSSSSSLSSDKVREGGLTIQQVFVTPPEAVAFMANVKEKFVTGSWGGKSASLARPRYGGKGAANGGGDDDDDVLPAGADDEEVYGDFEDLETGQKFGGDEDDDDVDNDEDEDEDGMAEDDEDDDGDSDEEEEEEDEEAVEARNDEIDKQLREMNAQRKANKKMTFDSEYDTSKSDEAGKKGKGEEDEEEEKLLEVAKQLQEERRARNKEEFGEDGDLLRVQYEGFRQGLYVRIVLQGVPVEFTRGFRSHLPVIMGALLPHENEMGFVRARVKRHRWHKRILKSSDPLIFSIGWRRFQSIPVYTMEDQNERERYLKYTPEHMHCTGTFFGPVVPPNTGILAFQKTSSETVGFRLCMTGTVLERQATPKVVKKLKLVGTPFKIFKNTAFISGMFTSALEVAKFEGAKIKTVSGIRGQIKKAIREGEAGSFRATFEDKILMGDIIVCRMWVPVEMKRFYNPVLSMLEEEGPTAWQGMRPIAQIRREEKIAIPVNKDSLYKPIVRQQREFRKMVVPKKLQEALPYASKPKLTAPTNPKSYLARRAVVLEPEEKKQRAAVQIVSAIGKDKMAKRALAKQLKGEKAKKAKAKVAEYFDPVHKEEKKRKYRESGKEATRRESKAARTSSRDRDE